MHVNILKFKRGRYFYTSCTVLVVCWFLYFSQMGEQPPNGGTWQGYVLGVLAALIIVWLAALGIRKRQYSSSLGSVQSWVSAHVYYGVSVLIISTLHCAVQFGFNVHTLAYALMVLVITSGIFGLYFYLRYPRLVMLSRSNHSREELFTELGGLNEGIRSVSLTCDSEVQRIVDSAIDRTQIGGGLFSQIFAVDGSKMLTKGKSEDSMPVNNKDQAAIVDFVGQRIPRSIKRNEAANLQELLSMLCRRQSVLRKIRRDIRYSSLMKLWLYLHIPLTFALLFSLLIHIVTVFFYW